MSLKIAIIGLPNVGKSTLFNALTKKTVEASNYPFCTIEPNIGLVKVPDERLSELAKISKPKKIIPAVVEFVDIAGLVKGAHTGEGLGNKFLSHIRECDAICQVVRNFSDDKIIHVQGKINPQNDMEIILTELIMADLETIEKRLAKATKEEKSGDKKAIERKKLLENLEKTLNSEQPVSSISLSMEEKEEIKDLHLLTQKPMMYVINGDKNLSDEIINKVQAKTLVLNIKLEEEISSLTEEEQKEYIKELEIGESGLNKLIKSAYRLLGLITFFTTGPDETRAWTVKNRTKAPQAAGVIHTDFEKGFIRAEIINWQNFISAKGEQSARSQGLIRTEGKDYVIQDGDICNFLFN